MSITASSDYSTNISGGVHTQTTPGKFKGVVPAKNGNCGAQIYSNQYRIWLGTFSSEIEAAMAYDSAAILLGCAGKDKPNLPLTDFSAQESAFHKLHTVEEILNMIRNKTYQNSLAEFIKVSNQSHNDAECNIRSFGDMGLLRHQLFQKELTPSDVGKLNRLVIPKKYATKYFPQLSTASERSEGLEDNGLEDNGGSVEDIELALYDKEMRSWSIRYCYWKSSQSFVFTRGWNRFVKEKELKAKDVVTFYQCEWREGAQVQGKQFCMIDIEHTPSETNTCSFIENTLYDGSNEGIGLELGVNHDCGLNKDMNNKMEVEPPQPIKRKAVEEKKGIWLFGVQLDAQ
ncbi:hypothetical protein IFM89_029273 [Coptis chinensis]|uniref:AP2/ERF and B3 domain-containing transcription factor n=1 Tax=Coptis chinensis TaxID=261450 RepID=A0A835HY17_9MAGN|nr:hypothetical protein IFM89_029273 [Coptis chinensis]